MADEHLGPSHQRRGFASTIPCRSTFSQYAAAHESHASATTSIIAEPDFVFYREDGEAEQAFLSVQPDLMNQLFVDSCGEPDGRALKPRATRLSSSTRRRRR